MPSCLGIYAEKNIIKYAKISKDKTNNLLNMEFYGIKFSDNYIQAIKEIMTETNSSSDDVAINLLKEEYVNFDIFSRLKQSDMKQLLRTEYETYSNEKGVPPSLMEMRHIIVKNTGKPDTYKAICVSANKTQLTNIWQELLDYKITSIAPIGVSIQNLLPDKGIQHAAVIINIEEITTVTVLLRGEIAKITTIPMGMNDILSKLADKYNSYAKAYEACKSVSAYVEDVYSIDEESRTILDLVLPTLYDLKEHIDEIIKEYGNDIKDIFITGSGVIVNNMDLYFQDAYSDKNVEILRPFFINKDVNNLKDIIEVNGATAIALNGLGYISKNVEFYSINKAFLSRRYNKEKN